MSAGRVVLVRHAQASFGSSDYDRLSDHGLAQAARFGTWLADSDRGFLWLASGTMRRHEQTVAAVAHAFAHQGATLPQCRLDPDWNEFDHAAVIRAWAHAHPDEPILAAALAGHDKRAMHAVLAAALHAWTRGELRDLPETWDAFEARIDRARARLAREAPDGAALVISSGGAIARCAQAALGIDHERTVELNLGLRNTGVCEFRRDDDAWRLLAWNAVPHFSGRDERTWVTYY
ncbi:MAG TPA: histidine phosphatase family protein [Rudaea sp.]